MSDTSSLFVHEEDTQPVCPLEPFLPDTSASDNDSDSDKELAEDSEDDALYCMCRKTARGFMVGCDGDCDDWFHGACVGVKEEQKDLLKKFFCPSCTEDGQGVTIWEGAIGKKGEVEEQDQDQDMVDNSDDEDNIVVHRSNKLLRQHLSTGKKAALPPQAVAPVHKKRVGVNKLRAHPALKRRALTASSFAAAKRVPISQKLKYSQPNFTSTPPGFRAQQPENYGGDDGDVGSDADDDMDTLDGAGLEVILTAGHYMHKSAVKFPRRTYVDVEEAHTQVDVMVKKCLEKALFGIRA